MSTKLTLNINESVIESAKSFAREHKTSLSKLIENYLSSLTKEDNKESKISPLVESLTGVIPDNDPNDYRKEYYDYLEKKYS